MADLKPRAMAKTVAVNIAILCLFLIGPAIMYSIYRGTIGKYRREAGSSLDPRSSYEFYRDREMAAGVYSEKGKLTASFRSYIGWRRDPASFKYTNVNPPYNTRRSSGESLKGSVWFFGGSTIWGTGVADAQTVPSYYNEITGKSVYNLGESGWTSRQSLDQLINLINDGLVPENVVFYDGVNDIISQCRLDIPSVPAYSREGQIKAQFHKLRNSDPDVLSSLIPYAIKPYQVALKKLGVKSNQKLSHDCDRNGNKSTLIAKHLVGNWYIAYLLSKSVGADFYAILQPQVYTYDGDVSYFVDAERLNMNLFRDQIEYVYPKIYAEMQSYCIKDKDFCMKIFDGTSWLNGRSNVYIDFCHLSPAGNKYIAIAMANIMRLSRPGKSNFSDTNF